MGASSSAARAREVLRVLTIAQQPRRGEMALRPAADGPVPVAVRADVVRRLRDTIHDTGRPHRLGSAAVAAARHLDGLVTAILANATAALDEIGGSPRTGAVPLLQEVERSLRHAADLSEQILSHAVREPRAEP